MIPPGARNFVASETIDGALDYVSKLNDEDITGMLNHLGEHYHEGEDEEVEKDVVEYLNLINEIDDRGLNSVISVKPSQLGVMINDELFVQNLERLLNAAVDNGVFVWMDMEDSDTTDSTLEAYHKFSPSYPDSLGVCLQANLKRTLSDIDSIEQGRVRMVKGAYNEPAKIAFQDKNKINEKYKQCLNSLNKRGIDYAVASHDMNMVEHAISKNPDLELQMLMGVKSKMQRELAEDFRFSQYVPYGEEWIPYFYRRIRENKSNIITGIRSLIGV